MKCLFSAFLICLFASAVSADAVVSNVRMSQQWPWNVKVHIDYDITGVDATAPQDVIVTAYTGTTPLGELPSASLTGSRYAIQKDGTYRITFDPAKSSLLVRGNLSQFKVALSLKASTANSEILYKILDLATGRMTDVSRAELLNGNYGAVETNFNFVGTTSLENVLIWTGVTNNIAYKTTHLVFRKIPAGSFTMGRSDTSSNCSHSGAREPAHPVRLTRDFYIGVFRLTRGQWKMIQGRSPHPDYSDVVNSYAGNTYDDCPATYMNYDVLRGNYSNKPSEGGDWPGDGNRVAPTSFIGQLREAMYESGYEVDLPTEAQWEYACRAGTTTVVYDGKTDGSLGTRQLRLAYPEDGDLQTPVGTRLPNAFGLYDNLAMNGSCGEVVLDYSNTSYGCSDLNVETVDPVGGSKEEYFVEANGRHWPRVMRGFGARADCRSFIRTDQRAAWYNCRLALHVEGWTSND